MFCTHLISWKTKLRKASFVCGRQLKCRLFWVLGPVCWTRRVYIAFWFGECLYICWNHYLSGPFPPDEYSWCSLAPHLNTVHLSIKSDARHYNIYKLNMKIFACLTRPFLVTPVPFFYCSLFIMNGVQQNVKASKLRHFVEGGGFITYALIGAAARIYS